MPALAVEHATRMLIHSAQFIKSSIHPEACPAPTKPEFAFVGRSNVGKSSLINLLAHRKGLAKTSSMPGKTQTINHFLINDSWYLADLPGYGYAKVSRSLYKGWEKTVTDYVMRRENLYCVFVLVDARHAPRPSDLALLKRLGIQKIPLAIAMTKSDKLSRPRRSHARERLCEALYADWEELPPIFVTSSRAREGREEIYRFIEKAMARHF